MQKNIKNLNSEIISEFHRRHIIIIEGILFHHQNNGSDSTLNW